MLVENEPSQKDINFKAPNPVGNLHTFSYEQ